MNKKAHGFTIVELLIAIVVIAILAAITIVAYSGIQDRAYNAKIVTGVKNYRNALEAYKAQHDTYPTTTPEENGDHIAMVCLGTGYANGNCGRVTDTDVYEDEVFNTAIRTIFGTAPALVNDQAIPSGPEAFVGAVYGLDITDSSQTGYSYARSIQYALHGDSADCVLPGAWSYRLTESPAVTACEIVLEGLAP